MTCSRTGRSRYAVAVGHSAGSLSLSLFGRFDFPKDLDGSSVPSSRFFSTAPSRTDEGKCSSCSRVSAHRFDAISFSFSFSFSFSLSLSLWVKC